MTTLTKDPGDLSFLVSEASGFRSRDTGVVDASGGALKAGTILGKRNSAGASSSAGGGNTGNGALTLAADPVLADGVEGVYTVTFIAAAANGGTYEVRDPNGVDIGRADVGDDFTNQIAFAIADGATDFAVADSFTITVAAGDGDYVAYDPTATNGAEDVAGVLGFAIGAEEAERTIIVRDAEAAQSALTYHSGANDAAKAVANAGLKALGIIVR